MKYELETIPIWDTYRMDGECPLCILDEKAERGYIDFFLGNSVMVPEMRVEVNKTGFCPGHWLKLFEAEKNRHPLGLVCHTHLKESMSALEREERGLAAKAGKTAKLDTGPDDTEGETGPLMKLISRYAETLRGRERDCMICSRVDYTVKRYAFTIVYLWRKDREFREAFDASRGFCHHHLPFILEMAVEVLGRKDLGAFVCSTLGLQEKSLRRLEGELLWFTQKFDYQNDQKPWGTSKDALNRTLQKLSGKIMHERQERKKQ